jgi:hypothetical protein
MRNKNIPASYDITRITLAVLFIGALITASFWIMKPFLSHMGNHHCCSHVAASAETTGMALA